MIERSPLSTPARWNACAFVVTAAGMVLQTTSGSTLYPTIPPGPIILLVGAGVVALGLRRWSPIVGLVVPVFLTVGGILATASGSGFLDQLDDPAEVGIFAGTALHLVGLSVALVTGILAVTPAHRSGRPQSSQPGRTSPDS